MNFENSNFEFVSDFGFRNSKLGNCKQKLKAISIIVLAAFLFMQTNAYGQQLGIPVSANQYRVDRERAMLDAVFEAEYKLKEAERRPLESKKPVAQEPMRGKREKEIIQRYKLEQEMERDLRAKRPIAEEELERTRPEKRIPRDADLGTGFSRKINEAIYPFKISGEYQASWGYDWGDEDSEGHRGMWKNADFNKANMVYVLDNQYVFGVDRENTYDKRIYDRFRLRIESIREEGLNTLSEIVIDPWSFVGKTDLIMVNGPAGQFPLELRYWSGTESTLSERVWLTSGVDFINIPEIKVGNDRTHPTFLRTAANEVDYTIPEVKIQRDFRPLRKLEVNYTSDWLDFKVFPLADPDHAYTSDDPLMLSNRYTYSEPSPWLNNWEPALFFPATRDFRRGGWANGIAFEARDSDFNYLTLLRGASFEMYLEDTGTYLGGAAATPLNLWQKYDSVNSIPGAVRFKQRLFDDYYIGATYTFNYGFIEGDRIDALNHVFGVDAGFEIPDFVTLRGEYARSIDRMDRYGHARNITCNRADGNALRIEAKGQFLDDEEGDPMLKVSGSFTHMGDNFRARLSNYRGTRQDQIWGKHIRFKPVSEDFDAFRIGDGIDIGRDVYHLRVENVFYKDVLDSLFDVRFVKRDWGPKIEDVYREEITFRPLENLTSKFLYRYQDMPRTIRGRDPYIITDYISGDNTDELVINDDVPGGENASAWTLSGGFHYDIVEWLGVEGIYERTNDYDIFPQYALNDATFRDLGEIRELSYFLYGQPLIAIPAYDDYGIYKARVFFTPQENIRTKFEYVYNGFKHATGRDDNISHYGVEVDIDFTEKFRSAFKFTRSQIVDLFMQEQRQDDVPFYSHNNIFAQISYDIDENNTFIAQFGEFFVPAEFTPVPWLLNTIDTQRIIRFYLKGRF